MVIPAWSFARGNAQIHESPDEYADAGPVVGPGPERPWGWTVEYDVAVPYYGTYRGKRNLQDKDHPDFRALPLVGK